MTAACLPEHCARSYSLGTGRCPGACELAAGLVHSRWHNLPTEELAALELATRRERYLLKLALHDRLVAESGIEIGAVYRVANDGRSLAGRRLWVEGVNAGVAGTDLHGENPWYVFAWGRLDGKSAAGDGWTIRRQQVRVERLVKL